MRRKMRREFRNDRAQCAERLRQIQMPCGSREFDVPGLRLHAFDLRIEHSFDGRDGALDHEILRSLRDDREPGGFQEGLRFGDIRAARPELLFELRRRQPLMVVGGGRVRLTLQQLLQSVGMSQR